MAFDHGRKLLIGLEPLPLQARSPVLEEAPCPSFALIVPKLTEALLEQIGGVEPLVGRQQGLQCFLAVEREHYQQQPLADSLYLLGDSWKEVYARARGNFVTLAAGDLATRPAHIGSGQLRRGAHAPLV